MKPLHNYKSVTRITTSDTKKTYEFTGPDTPRLWAVDLQINSVNTNGLITRYSSDTPTTVFLERETLKEHGLFPRVKTEVSEPVGIAPTVEDLILDLLGHLGVYPEQ